MKGERAKCEGTAKVSRRFRHCGHHFPITASEIEFHSACSIAGEEETVQIAGLVRVKDKTICAPTADRVVISRPVINRERECAGVEAGEGQCPDRAGAEIDIRSGGQGQRAQADGAGGSFAEISFGEGSSA